MKLSIPLKDIMIAPGKRFDPAEYTDQDVITRIKKLYGVIAEVMDIAVEGGMVHIEFRDATPEKHKEAMGKLRKGIEEAQKGQPAKALNLFKEVLAVIPENLDARRNMAKAYLELNNIEKAKKIFQEVLQLNPADHGAAISLGNIYARNENNFDVAAFYYEFCLQHHPDDAMLTCNYAALMFEKGEFQKSEVLFKHAIKGGNLPNAYYGLALLYQMAGEVDASKSVLETMFVRIPQQTLPREYARIYADAKNLYSDLSKEKKH
ncbi:MAG: tetratricopeptide repeat protein [Deltaproteobacteria bacterium]|nr:MAG: tetratricopeptide repeat protein [Deltaproteobacteria bacterium]